MRFNREQKEALLNAAEEAPLWDVVYGFRGLLGSGTDDLLRSHARRVLADLVDRGWIALRSRRYEHGKPTAHEKVLSLVDSITRLDSDAAWQVGPPRDGEEHYVVLTGDGRAIVEAGALDDVYDSIQRRDDS